MADLEYRPENFIFLLSFMRCVFRILHFVAEFQQGIFNIVEAGGRRFAIAGSANWRHNWRYATGEDNEINAMRYLKQSCSTRLCFSRVFFMLKKRRKQVAIDRENCASFLCRFPPPLILNCGHILQLPSIALLLSYSPYSISPQLLLASPIPPLWNNSSISPSSPRAIRRSSTRSWPTRLRNPTFSRVSVHLSILAYYESILHGLYYLDFGLNTWYL